MSIGLITTIGLNYSLLGIDGQHLFKGINLAINIDLLAICIISYLHQSANNLYSFVLLIQVSENPSNVIPLLLEILRYSNSTSNFFNGYKVGNSFSSIYL